MPESQEKAVERSIDRITNKIFAIVERYTEPVRRERDLYRRALELVSGDHDIDRANATAARALRVGAFMRRYKP